jgi:hypothetical protein
MLSWDEILKMPANARVEFPKLPAGEYAGTIKSATLESNPKTNEPYVKVMVEIVEPFAVEDEEALKDYGPLTGKTIPWFFNSNYESQVKKFETLVDNCGLSHLKDYGQALEQMEGKTILVTIKHGMWNGAVQENIDGSAKY